MNTQPRYMLERGKRDDGSASRSGNAGCASAQQRIAGVLKRALHLYMLLMAPFVLAAGPATQPSRITKPSTIVPAEQCVTANCHPSIKSSIIIHGPVAANTCDACHEPVDVSAHTYQLTRQKEALCTYCHEFDVSSMAVIHKPVAEGECLGCHDPHGGNNHSLVREKTVAELCGRCHDSMTHDRKFVHDPVAKGACDSCHPPHASRFPKLVDAIGSDLCLACHADFDTKMASVQFRHKALEKGCIQCHDVHGSDYPMNIVEPVVDLCISCHEKVRDRANQSKFKHSVVFADRACITCHTPHGGDQAKLMSDQPAVICMKCHKDAVKTPTGEVIAAAPEVSDVNMVKHGAIKDGQCGGCHSSHGSDQPMLLAKVYNKTFYQRFSRENYELCFSCHDVNLVQEEQTSKSTGFRNGTMNLHYIHANAGDRDKSCSVCHSPHGSLNPRIMRDRIRYGTWQMPIRFSKTETGGSCFPGCHTTSAYDREHPAPPPTTAPAKPNKPVIARAEHAKPRMINWIGQDQRGSDVAVPDAHQPTLLVILGPEDELNRQFMKSVEATVGEIDALKRIVILSGDEIQQLPEFSAKWSIVDDGDYTNSRQIGVVGWPTAMVVGSDGTEIARLGGAPDALAVRLRPYLDLAARQIDRAELDRELARHETVGQGSESAAAHDLQVAKQFLSSGKPQEARRILTDILKLRPDNVPARLAMIQALADLGRITDAIDMLNKLPPRSVTQSQAALLRARILLANDQWEEARQLLTDTIKRTPDLSDAHYLLGRIYEHDADWQKAAQEYRAMHEEK